jgi:hypothetical protein
MVARGWESKSVEQQQEEQLSCSVERKSARLTADEIADKQRRRGWVLSRQRLLEQLRVASKPEHRAMLEAALAELNARLQGQPEEGPI